MGKFFTGAETVGAVQVGEEDVLTLENNIVALKLGRYEQNDV